MRTPRQVNSQTVGPPRISSETCTERHRHSALTTTPPLTTVMQDIRGAGQALVETLLAQIEGRDLPPRKLPGTLVVRRSSGAA